MRSKHRTRDRKGAITVEFAILANAMFVVLFGCFELTRLSLIRSLAQDAAYFAARAAMIPGATASDATNEANRIMATMGTKGVQVKINNGLGISQTTSELRLEVIIDLKKNMMLIPLLPECKELRAVSTMKTERYNETFSGG